MTKDLFSQKKLSHENSDDTFTGLVAIEESFDDLHFQNCTFIGCQFIQSRFLSCVFEDCVFERCDLSLIAINNSSFVEAQFKDCKCVGINWTVAGQRLSLRFEKSNLTRSSFLERKIPELYLKDCLCHEANFSAASLPWSDFSGSDFKGALFNQTDLQDTTFQNAKNYAIHPVENKVKGATFSFPEAMNLLADFEIRIN